MADSKKTEEETPIEYVVNSERVDPGEVTTSASKSMRSDPGEKAGYLPTQQRFDAVIDTYLAKQQLAKEQAAEEAQEKPKRRARKTSLPSAVDDDPADEPDEE